MKRGDYIRRRLGFEKKKYETAFGDCHSGDCISSNRERTHLMAPHQRLSLILFIKMNVMQTLSPASNYSLISSAVGRSTALYSRISAE